MAIADVSDKSLSELISLRGRCALVTGGAHGLGKAIARRLAEAGASVVIGDIDQEAGQKTAAELSAASGVRVIATAMDVTSESAVAAAADLAIMEFGRLDIWVNNAGIFPFVSLVDMSAATWDQVMSVNLRGLFLGSREAAKRMIAAKRGGVIVNISSMAGVKGTSAGLGAYVTSKHGVGGATKQMAIELAPHDIRVMAVAPTHCATERNLAILAANPEIAKNVPATVSSPLGRVGVPDDIGRVVLFCASDLSIFMSGSTLMVDASDGA